MYKVEDFIKQEIDEEVIFVHKSDKTKLFGRFPYERSYYIPHNHNQIFNTKQEVINYLNKNL